MPLPTDRTRPHVAGMFHQFPSSRCARSKYPPPVPPSLLRQQHEGYPSAANPGTGLWGEQGRCGVLNMISPAA
jgi:hypothetical protein